MATRVSFAFGDLLRRCRVAAGLTQEHLAERAGLSARAISDLERGVKQRPYPHTVHVLAAALALGEEDRTALEAAAGGRHPPASRPPPSSALSTLPVPPTPFIGRERELEEVGTLLSQEAVRLLTLTGPGGIGKTRLALRTVEGVGEGFPDGLVFVSLASLSDPGLVPFTIAGILGGKEARGQSILESVTEYLASKRLLLLLDSFEHLLEAAHVVSRLLADCPRLTILVTSRAVLRLAAEHEYPVPPLPTPVPRHLPGLDVLAQYASVQLFLQRARSVRPDFRLAADNAEAIAEICHRLDGLPLAIELAAARLRLFPPQALLDRLSRDLTLLTGGPRDAPARQQTLRNTIDWSYRLLTLEEQTLFARLSVFSGGVSLEAAEAVCRGEGGLDVLEGVASLIDKSLLQQQEDEEPRFAVLETMREYGLERLEEWGETEAIRRRHAEWVLRLAEEAEPHLRGRDQAAWLKRMEAEQDNVRAALTWARDRGEAEVGLRIGSALERFYLTHGLLSEGRAWLEELLQLDEKRGGVAGTPVRIGALVQASRLARSQGDPARAATLATEGLRLSRKRGEKQLVASCLTACGFAVLLTDTRQATALCEEALALRAEAGDACGAAEALKVLGMAAALQGEYERAVILTEESLARWQHCGDWLNIALTHLKLGDLALVASRDLDRAGYLYEQSLSGYRSVGHTCGMGHALASLAEVAQQQGDLERAQALAEESLVFLHAQGERHITGWATRILAEVVLSRGDTTRALALFRESLRLAQLVGDVDQIAAALEAIADLASARAHPERALRLYGAAAALREAARVERTPQRKALDDRALDALRETVDEESFALAWEAGRSMSRDEAVTDALDESD